MSTGNDKIKDPLPHDMPRCETCPFLLADPMDLMKKDTVCIYEPCKILGLNQQGMVQAYPRMQRKQTCGHHPAMASWLRIHDWNVIHMKED